MDYLDFYGLEQEPFSSAPVSKFYFNSAQHQRALVRLMYAVDTMKGLAVLIGELGTGKTTLARRMLDDLPEEDYESALLVIIHSGITADWLLARIARQLGVENPPPEKLKLLNQLFNRLVELHEEGKKAVVLIDEAQMLHSKEIMEEFRGLLNLELGESKLITFVFFGLPELEDHLHLDEPLAQRVALKCSLDSFNLESTEAYINHRLRLAGGQGQLFTQDSVKLLHHFSRGIPRLINTICDNSLFEGYLLKKKTVKPELVQSVASDLGLVPVPEVAPSAAPPQAPAQVIPVAGPRPPVALQPPAGQPPQPIEYQQPPMQPVPGTPAPVPPRVPAPVAMEPAPQAPPMPADPPPIPEPEAQQEVQQEKAPDEDIDAMFNGLTEGEQQPKEETSEENNIDSLLDGLEDK